MSYRTTAYTGGKAGMTPGATIAARTNASPVSNPARPGLPPATAPPAIASTPAAAVTQAPIMTVSAPPGSSATTAAIRASAPPKRPQARPGCASTVPPSPFGRASPTAYVSAQRRGGLSAFCAGARPTCGYRSRARPRPSGRATASPSGERRGRTLFLHDVGNARSSGQALASCPRGVVCSPASVPRLHLGVSPHGTAQSAPMGERCVSDRGGRGPGVRSR
jgi:hypothetical protein